MSYNPSIPLGTDPMIKSQKQIRANYQAITAVFAENHIKLNQEFQGRHQSLTFRIQPDPTTTAAQIALYTKLIVGSPALFFRPSSNQTPIQLTYSSISTGLASSNPDVYKTSQYSFVAGPFVIYGGTLLNPSNGDVIPLTPSSTLIYASMTKINDGSIGNTRIGSIGIISGGSSFTVRHLFTSVDPFSGLFNYFAIGKP
jgi:hypothetical protein